MKLKFLGTAAAEGIPALFCECDNCKYARKHLGKDFRTRSQSIINDDLLIDFSADTYVHSILNRIDFTPVCHCLISHSHSDHLYPADFAMRMHGFSNTREEIHTLNLYGSELVFEKLKAHAGYNNWVNDKAIDFHVIKPYEPFVVKDYKITAFDASHDPASGPVFYSIEKDGKCILHANDTGLFKDSVWEYIKSSGIHFDLVALDCTAADTINMTYSDCHLSVEHCRDIKSKLISIGAADEKTIFVLNHFSHNATHVLYDDLSERVKGEFLVSYDGMEIEI